jgi:hypothetical protein
MMAPFLSRDQSTQHTSRAPLCELRVRSVPRGQQSMSYAEGEADPSEKCIPDCKECSSNCEDKPYVTCTLN